MVVLCESSFPNNSKYESYFEWFHFPLSDFQKYSIKAIIDGNHSLVSAPTGSGKTLPAEFAIKYFTNQGKKVIYTSPIKALSNQKFHEFSLKFPDISFGLITGDIKTNVDASVLIMTTEILMNYLFSYTSTDGAVNSGNLQFSIDINVDLACVIFDEVHYINDVSRGENWEKTILMLPPHIQMVMLSATLNNKMEFAEWCEGKKNAIADNSRKEVVLSSTSTRIVPLSHYAFMTSTEGVFKGMTDKVVIKETRDNTNTLIPLKLADKPFDELNYVKVSKTLKLFETRRVFMKRKHVLNSLSVFLKNNDMLPALAFVFSRKNVEMCAREITTNLLEDDSKIPYIMRDECEKIVRKLPNFKEYLELPEYNELVSLLEKGIGIHHSGMISVLREIVEIMISKNYIKLLFATESFAIGLDCAIKTTIMTGITKFDGNEQRILHSHEYTQAAGRAGRRGRDIVGHVVHCNNLFHIPSLIDYKTMLGGKSQSLISKFRFSYPLVLNLTNNGKYCMEDFVRFAKKSMIYDELEVSIKNQKREILQIEEIIERKTGLIDKAIRTPKEVCVRFLELTEQFDNSRNKQRKAIERELESINTQNRYVSQDSEIVSSCQVLMEDLNIENRRLLYLETFVDKSIENVCNVLTSRKFLERTNVIICEGSPEVSTEYKMSRKGVVASGLAEIHPLVGSDCVESWNFFADFSSKQIATVLSVFSDVKIQDDLRSQSPDTSDKFMDARINEACGLFDKYEYIETELSMTTGIDYQNPVNFDMPVYVSEWWECEDELTCKIFIQTRLPEKGVSVGDFTKAVLKISSIVRELSMTCEKCGMLELLQKLSFIDAKILKYIVSSQSLYV